MTCLYIKGNQDTKKSEPPTDNEKINCDTDKLDTKTLSLRKTIPLKLRFTTLLVIDDYPTTTKYAEKITRAHNSIPMRTYFETKYRLKQNDMEALDWDAFAASLKKRTTSAQHRIIKLIHDWLPVTLMLSRFGVFRFCCS